MFDAIDALAADIAAVMKAQDDEFEHGDQLRTWLDEAGIVYDPGVRSASSSPVPASRCVAALVLIMHLQNRSWSFVAEGDLE